MRLVDYLKTIFFLVIIIQLAPSTLEYLKNIILHVLEPRTKVAVITCTGPLMHIDTYHQHLYKQFRDPTIKAILVRIESPGGAAGTAQALYQEIITLKKEYNKPIIALIENICTSAAYYLASATDYIIAPGTALVGGIGSSLPCMFNIKDFLHHFNIECASLKAGAYKDASNPFVPLTPENKALLQSVLDDTYQQFARDVATSRKLSISTINSWADGKLFTAQQALRLGLIDELGSLSLATTIIKEKALIEGEIEWIQMQQQSGIARFFDGEATGLIYQKCAHFIMRCFHVVASHCVLEANLYAR